MMRSLITLAAALSLVATPALAQSSASKLSVVSAARSSAQAEGSRLEGTGLWLAIGAAVVVAAVLIFVVFDDDDDDDVTSP